MKNLTPSYVAKEEAPQRKPVELYRIWRGDETPHCYTSGDVAIPPQTIEPIGLGIGNVEYLPATIKRSLIRYDSQLEVTKCSIQAAFVEDPVLEFVAINPVDIYWVMIMKLHREQLPLEADVIFLGQIKSVSFKGIQADVECVGFEHFLKMPIPTERYQITCNWKVFDLKCDNPAGACSKEGHRTTTEVTLDPTKTILTSSAFEDKPTGYFIGGTVEFGVEKRTIVAHWGDTITMSYRMINLDLNDDDISDGDVDAYPGCDGRAATCRDKFVNNNIFNFFGHPYIPIENPAMRT